jgi:hypothetical protein
MTGGSPREIKDARQQEPDKEVIEGQDWGSLITVEAAVHNRHSLGLC